MSKKRILLADDEPMVLRVLRLQLQNAGYAVETAPNGEEALNKILETAPDVLITDIEMPKMTGEELCKTLRDRLPERSFPIFVATSLTGLEHRRWAQSIANLHFLEKPLSARKLLAALDHHFNPHSCRGGEEHAS
ncbi:MAG: response regulator [Gammaproteobacteria bacterium]